ncbi:unnamed protein product [Pylaiella littoralis]
MLLGQVPENPPRKGVWSTSFSADYREVRVVSRRRARPGA